MPSQLTRIVFRNLIANEPLLYRGCRHRPLRLRTATTQHVTRSISCTQRRSFFGNLFKQQRKLKPAELPAGLEKLTEVAFAKENAIRPPKPAEVAQAIRDFFALYKGKFEDFHVASAHHALQYLKETPQDDGQPWLTRKDMQVILGQLLEKRPNVVGKWHLPFGQMLIDELANPTRGGQDKNGNAGRKDLDISFDMYIELSKVRLLSFFGAPVEARKVAARVFTYDSDAPAPVRLASLHAWQIVLESILGENDAGQTEETVDMLQDLSVPLTRPLQRTLVSHYAEKGDLEKAKSWYSRPVFSELGDPATPSGKTSSALLKACALKGDLAFGQELVATLLKDAMSTKEAWDAVFLWSVVIGKGPDEINRMIDVLIRRNDEAHRKDPSIPVIRPDVETINTLVEHCMSKSDPYLAERYIVLGENRGIIPDETTYTMQIAYRISVGDLDGARAAYFNLQGCFSGADRSVAAINQLIQALCVSNQNHFDELMAMVDDLHERKANFAPETVAAVTLLHLRRGEIPDAMDLLQVHAHQYAPAQRKIIRDALSVFILDGETSTADAWDGYQILRNVFAETPREDRIPIMNNFFARNRSDMACHVFFHMRNHISPTHRATKEVYTAAFTGFARCMDAESLELANNQLKLDLHVNMDTKLRNSLMLAYAATGEKRKALRYWGEICESKEGPSYNSILIAFRACEGMHLGSEHARSIWTRLKEQDIDIDKAIWTAYMCAIARNHNHDEALALIETAEDEYGFKLDLQILGSWFNCTANSDKQTRVEAWIKKRYPKIWDQLEALGHWVTMDGFGHRQYNINRDLDP